ncbi:MAG: SagB/ThcOx family dehydrogenase [Anaerolineales bacterium]|jgi:SagB-type dehydrogenase family enzyme
MKSTQKGWLAAAFLLTVVAGCAAPPSAPPGQAGEGDVIVLPTPLLEGPLSLEEAILGRRSVRAYGDQPLTLGEISQLLWSAQGVTDPRGFRTAPSAGALYPLELYLVLAEGVYHYEESVHQLTSIQQGDVRADLCEAALGQDAVRDAPAVVVITAVYARTISNYGSERGPQYVHLEAGHAAQNLLLQAVSLELGAVPIGAFYDQQVQEVLGIPADHQPLYLIPVGYSE